MFILKIVFSVMLCGPFLYLAYILYRNLLETYKEGN